MDWPSRELSQRLAEWSLCTPQDLQRCRPAVRRFVRDLPSFDSVWIDVLLQHRLLTPYQARVLDSSDPDRLRLAGHVIRDCVEENAWRGVYRARPMEGGPCRLLTVHSLHPEARVAALDSIDDTIARLKDVSAPGLHVPLRADVGVREMTVESADVEGTSLRELLVRRGRFPAAVAMAVARALAPILAVLEERGVAHSDLRPRNVWLDHDGQVHLLHAGVLRAVMPTFRVSQELPIDVCDGVAPEVAAGGGRNTLLSDQYSLGCLLWQLLAGRPPFPTADAHGKVAAHRSKSFPDIREIAPQAPEVLATALKILTRRAPAERFPGFRQVSLKLGAPTKADRKLLRKFFHTFQTEAPTQTARETVEHSRQLPSALAAVVISGATLWLFTSAPTSIGDRGDNQASTRPRTLKVDQEARPIEAAAPAKDSPVVQTAGTRSGSSVQPFPAADASGTVVLTAGATYLAKDLRQAGALVIRATDGGPARVIVAETAWQLSADSIRLENVQLECHAPVQLQCRGLDLSKSVIVGDANSLQWQPQDSAAVSPGTLTCADSHFVGNGLQLVSRPSMIRITNCLKTGSGPFLQVPAAGRAHQALQIQVTRTTLRESGPLLAWTPGPRAAGQRIEVVTKACVFAPAAGTPLLALAGSIAPSEWERSIGISGLESLLRSGTKVVDLVPPPGKPRGAIDASKLEVDGLLTATIEFFGTGSDDAASCGLKSTDALFSVDQPPGVQVDKVATRMAAIR